MPKQVKVELVDPGHPVHKLVKNLVVSYHEHLIDARIAVVWRKEVKPDVDGKVQMGSMKKGSDLDRELHVYDWVLVLNEEVWNAFDDKQREALVYHYLCHAQVALDRKTRQVKTDSRGRPVYRKKKPDVVEFSRVIDRYGLYTADLADFADKVMKHRATPLFPDIDESPAPNGEPTKPSRKRPSRSRRTASA